MKNREAQEGIWLPRAQSGSDCPTRIKGINNILRQD